MEAIYGCSGFLQADQELDRVTPSQMPCTGTEIALCC